MSREASVNVNIMGPIWFIIGAGLSWVINHSIGWAIWHGVFAGFYVLYLCLGFGGGFDAAEAGLTQATVREPVVVRVVEVKNSDSNTDTATVVLLPAEK